MSARKIYVDAGGGDRRAHVIAGALTAAIDLHGKAEVTLVGPVTTIRRVGCALGFPEIPSYIPIIDNQLVADPNTPPDSAHLRKIVRGDYSVTVATKLAKESGGGVISCGSTAALYANAVLVAKSMLSGIRPGLVATMPTVYGGRVLLMDAGGTVDCTAEELVAFAKMGAVYAQAALGIDLPRVTLLANGTEACKGDEVIRSAHSRLSEQTSTLFCFCGNTEASQILAGSADVFVADGLLGNTALKGIEGGVRAVGYKVREATSRSWRGRLGGLLLRRDLRQEMSVFDPRQHNAAVMLGCNVPMIKGHGNSDKVAAYRAVRAMYELLDKNLLGQIRTALEADQG